MTDVDAAVAAIRDGKLAIVPTDTVYGLATSPHREEFTRRLYAAKGRGARQPTALVAASVEVLCALLPELDSRLAPVLPGPYTLVVPNPERRFPWLLGDGEAIGVRVPALDGVALELLTRAESFVATSANLPGEPDPRTLADVPPELRAAAAALVDGGELPGTPSTVIDLTGPDPVVLREGAVPASEALRAVASVL